MPVRGRFITLEGIDGAGKSTHVDFIADAMRARGVRVVATREPGGTPLGEQLRELVLHMPMSHSSEVLLMFAARQEHVDQVIRPTLERGDWVLCDRFTDATFAYQGGGHGVDIARIDTLARWVHVDCQPDVTLLFDVPAAVSRARLQRAVDKGRGLDKFEREPDDFVSRVRDVYHARAAAEPRRFRIIDSARPLAAVRAELQAIVASL
ncbi:MAG: dTMP kinase [Betaproteobacteria bacterium]